MSLTIIKINGDINGSHEIQSQSGRVECWEEGYIAVPENLVDAVWACMGCCDLVIEDGVLIDIIPTEQPVEPEPEPATDLETRVTALENAIERGLNL